MFDPTELENILKKAKDDCYNLQNAIPTTEKVCNLIFDGIMCWKQTPAGILANQSCSNKYIKSIKNVS